jgi:predicted metal-binding membrane protein
MTEPIAAPAAVRTAVPVTAATLTTLAVAAAAWVVALRQLNWMDLSVETELGSFASFVGFWAAMMAAMMLPGTAVVVFRRARVRCRNSSARASTSGHWSAGFAFAVSCVGSSIGLMLVLPASGVMSVTWMSLIAAVMFVQKLVPEQRVVDVTLALAIVGLGSLIVASPALVPVLNSRM